MTLLKKPTDEDIKVIQKLAQEMHNITCESGQPLYIILRAITLEMHTYLRWWRENAMPDIQTDKVTEKGAFVAEKERFMRNQYMQAICLLLLGEFNIDMSLQTLDETVDVLRKSK